MEIAIIAEDNKKELMAQFCIAYCGALSKHNLCATGVTGTYISDATGLQIDCLLTGTSGGTQQITSRIAYDEIDLLLFFRSNDPNSPGYEDENALLRLCDIHNVPFATNFATAEVLVRALDAGELDYREFINPKSEYNQRHRKI